MKDILNSYWINSTIRKAAFLSQCHHESAGFKKLEENLNYNPLRLTQIWPNRFPNVSFAKRYAHNPIALGNFVYSNRMGNGNELSGDGYKFRGRGLLQITGRVNYEIMHGALNIDCINNPDLLLVPDNAIRSACIIWTKLNLNQIADKEDIAAITKKINGGTNGLQERIFQYKRYKKLLSIDPDFNPFGQ